MASSIPSATVLAVCAAALLAPAHAGERDAGAGIPPGMNARGEVVEPSRLAWGHGQAYAVRGFYGEIVGRPVSARLGSLRIGMSMAQVVGLAGRPDDQKAYLQQKKYWYGCGRRSTDHRSPLPLSCGWRSAWQPLPAAPSGPPDGAHPHQFIYRGEGRLVFALDREGTYRLNWVVHSRSERGQGSG